MNYIQYFHRSICFLWETALNSEKVDLEILHWIVILTIIKIPVQIKADNPLVYVFIKWSSFLYYNPKHFAIIPHALIRKIDIERFNHALKDMLNKQKGVIKTPEIECRMLYKL